MDSRKAAYFAIAFGLIGLGVVAFVWFLIDPVHGITSWGTRHC
jgi:hypothetical protein